MISRDTFDAHLQGKLNKANCAQPLKDMWAKYQLAKSKIEPQVLSWIPKTEPNLSDHGILHIDNVLENAARLLGLDAAYSLERDDQAKPFDQIKISAVETYVLGMALLFHDTGNVLSRSGHADTGNSVMAELMKNILLSDEIRPIGLVMSAHSGVAGDGTSDRINTLPETPEYVNKEPVRLRPLAALVRFADELAEGPQRTSNFLRDRGGFTISVGTENARNPFHDYASVTRVNIDRGSGRIAITYSIDLDDTMFGKNAKRTLKFLLAMICARIRKTDDERRYARFYGGDWLAPFKTTEVVIRFYRGLEAVDPQLPPLVIGDLVIPGAHGSSANDKIWLKERHKAYDVEAIIQKVKL